MSSGTQCDCARWADRQIIGMGYETADLLDAYETVRERTPWLRLERCSRCGEHWYVAVDTVDDHFYFRRLTPTEVAAIIEQDQWPSDFDRFAHVWPDPADLSGLVVEYPWR